MGPISERWRGETMRVYGTVIDGVYVDDNEYELYAKIVKEAAAKYILPKN